MSTITLTIGWWLMLVVGLVPATWFLAFYRPARWREAPTKILRGLVVVVAVLFATSALSTLLAGGVPVFRGGWPQVIPRFALGIYADVKLLRLLHIWRAFRREYARHHDDTSPSEADNA